MLTEKSRSNGGQYANLVYCNSRHYRSCRVTREHGRCRQRLLAVDIAFGCTIAISCWPILCAAESVRMSDLVGSLPESVQVKTIHAKKSWVGLWGQSVVVLVVEYIRKGYLWRILTNKEVV
ncbi:hypothetical protein Fmac_010043 [Flemingia macrophylla]|uniref:Uncharacterized protein n=1 Tax=Flemingia macrophylla TaxID=520843 RepID=A0ABD1N1Y2_9FABA